MHVTNTHTQTVPQNQNPWKCRIINRCIIVVIVIVIIIIIITITIIIIRPTMLLRK